MLQSWSIFWSVLIRKKVRKPKSVDDGDGAVMVLDERKVRIGAPELTEEELMGGPVRRTSDVDPSQYNSDHYSVRPGVVVKVRPREGLNEIMVPDTGAFMSTLTSEDLEHLDKGMETLTNIEIDVGEVKSALELVEDKNN